MSHGVQSFILGIAAEVVIMTISVAIHSKGRNRSMSTHPKIKKKTFYKELCYKYTISQSQTTLQTAQADSKIIKKSRYSRSHVTLLSYHVQSRSK